MERFSYILMGMQIQLWTHPGLQLMIIFTISQSFRKKTEQVQTNKSDYFTWLNVAQPKYIQFARKAAYAHTCKAATH